MVCWMSLWYGSRFMMVQDELELWMIGRPLKGPEVDF